MPKVLFNQELEIQFLQYFHDVSMDSQGKMVSQAEKLSFVTDKPNKFAKDSGLGDLTCTASILKKKLDWVRKKAKKLYEQVRKETGTGISVKDEYDLEVYR